MTDDIGAGLSTGHNNSRGLESIAEELKASGAPFVVATVVRTVAVTAAKPGAKAIIAADGTLLTGWIGGGCARHSVVVAAKKLWRMVNHDWCNCNRKNCSMNRG
jgi:xanthine/CO dehydrogenase XdhC/CoxF family maturation factor